MNYTFDQFHFTGGRLNTDCPPPPNQKRGLVRNIPICFCVKSFVHIPRALSFELDSSGNWTWACCDADVAVSYFQTYSATEIDLPKRPDGSHRILISLCTLNSSVLYNRNGNDSKLRIAWSLPVLYIKWTCTVWICNYYTLNIRYLMKTGILCACAKCVQGLSCGGGRMKPITWIHVHFK